METDYPCVLIRTVHSLTHSKPQIQGGQGNQLMELGTAGGLTFP